MSPAVAPALPRPDLFGAAADASDREDRGGERTLDDVIVGAWEALIASSSGRGGQAVACPVCAGPMRPRYAAGAVPVAGRCERCASELD